MMPSHVMSRPRVVHSHRGGLHVGQWLLRILGAVLMLWGLSIPMLGLWGAQTDATVTQIRRQGGERGEAIPNRYTFIVSYRFVTADGQMIENSTQMIGDFANVPALQTAQPLKVRYLAQWPRFNSLTLQARLNIEHLIVAAVGWLLMIGIWRGKAKHRIDAQGDA